MDNYSCIFPQFQKREDFLSQNLFWKKSFPHPKDLNHTTQNMI